MSKQQKKSKKQEEEILTLGDESTETRCPYCGTQTMTEVIFTNGLVTYLLALISILLLGVFVSMLLIPIIFVFTKQLMHKCSSCEQEIGTNGEVIFGSKIKDGIVSMKIGELGCILTKKILLTTIVGVITVLIIWYRITHITFTKSYNHSHMHDAVVYTNTTWPEFKEDCGIDKLLTHQKFHDCEDTYIDKSIHDWTGYIIRVEDYRQTLYQYLHHAVSILVKMENSETEDHADLLLTFDSEMVDLFEETLNDIGRGDQIGFNATFKSLGTPQQTRHMHVLKIWKMQGKIDIAAHIHNGGRYDDTPRRMRGKADEPPLQIAQAEQDEDQADNNQQKNIEVIVKNTAEEEQQNDAGNN